MKTLATTLLLVTSLSVAGCGTVTPAPRTADAEGGTLPITARALAAVASEHAGEPASATREADAAEEFKKGGVGTELRYGSDGEYDDDMLVVAVGTGLAEDHADCDAPLDGLDGCAQVDGGVLFWEEEAPEEDPGVVYLVSPKEKGTVLVFYAGPTITKDPRDLDLPIPVDDLLAIATDPRVDVTTSQAALDAGAGLDFWRD